MCSSPQVCFRQMGWLCEYRGAPTLNENLILECWILNVVQAKQDTILLPSSCYTGPTVFNFLCVHACVRVQAAPPFSTPVFKYECMLTYFFCLIVYYAPMYTLDTTQECKPPHKKHIKIVSPSNCVKTADIYPDFKQTFRPHKKKRLAHFSHNLWGQIPLVCCNSVCVDATHSQTETRWWMLWSLVNEGGFEGLDTEMRV